MGERPYLYSYNLVFDFPAFLLSVRNEANDVANDWEYVAVAEKRCFNLFYAYYPDTEKLCSFQGLLTQCAQFADYYKNPPQNARRAFPKVLLVDDLLIHGRRLRKFIDQMENGILDFLDPNREFNAEQEYCFHRDFLDAIGIRVFAKTIGTILLEDRYIEKIKAYKILSYGELRDLSLQLSDTLPRWDISNTNYTPSVWMKSIDKAPKGWYKVTWKYEDELMYLFIRNNSNRKSISTIRLFPDRCLDNGFIPVTSYTIIGRMKKQTFDNLCDDISLAIKKYENTVVQVCYLLESKIKYIEAIKRELIDYFISLFDLCSFLEEIDEQFSTYNALLKYGFDVKKIALNFGCRAQIKREYRLSETKNTSIEHDFTNILKNNGLCNRIREILTDYEKVYPEIMPDLFDCKLPSKNDMSRMYETVNQNTLNYFFELGLRAEEQAYDLARTPYLFYSGDYLEYKYNGSEGDADKGRDGGTLLEINELMKEIRIKNYYPYYCYLASIIYMMDCGIYGNRGYITKDDYSFTLVKAGELATMYFPKLVAAFIPAFSYIEDCFNFMNSNKANAISDFFETVRNTPCEKLKEIVHQYLLETKRKTKESDQDEADEKTDKIIESMKNMWPTSNELFNITTKLYRAGQNYSGWNFLNICHPNYKILFPLQKAFKVKAKEFMKNRFY